MINKNEVSIISDRRVIRIFIGNTIHLYLLKKGLLGFQSWIHKITDEKEMRQFSGDRKYCTEYTYSSGATIMTEYDNRVIWEEISKLINEHLKPTCLF